jgi:hypothetical protein
MIALKRFLTHGNFVRTALTHAVAHPLPQGEGLLFKAHPKSPSPRGRGVGVRAILHMLTLKSGFYHAK